MAVAYSVEAVRKLQEKFRAQDVRRPLRIARYEPGTVLEYDIRGVVPDGRAAARFEIVKFVGGGFAGQVYQVKLLALAVREGEVRGLEAGRVYALKILIPPSGLAKKIRDLFYGFAFQGPFSLQVTPAAGRAQALWQKFIRRAAKIEFGREDGVADILATLVDKTLGSCGEVLEWVDGRLWRFEVDDNLDARRASKPGRPAEGAGSPEYRAKRTFMDRLVRLMHRMGAVELARQYEWWSLKSQPNALKRLASDPDPEAGLVAVDFKAGMALTPVTPQCPADIKLVFQGLFRGSLVQFDRGDFRKLEGFLAEHSSEFADMAAALDELKTADAAYRDSLIDVTHHHVRLLGARLRRSIMAAMRESWRIRNMTDEKAAAKLARSGLRSLLYMLFPFLALATPVLFVFAFPGSVWWKYPLWLAPLFAVPFLRRLWGRGDLRRHYAKMLTSPRYFLRAGRARIAETLIRWHRQGRVSHARALKLADAPLRFYLHLPLSFLPPGLHRMLTDKKAFLGALYFVFVRPVRLYFKTEEREKWLRDMIAAGERNGMLTRDEAAHIDGQIKEPFIQKYLKSLAIHIVLMPTTHVVALIVAFIYLRFHAEMTWQQASLTTGVIFALFQIIPISPGSIARGIYTTSLILRERNFKDYRIAFWMSFFKYIGYFSFPVQMAYRYPDLARFMAGHTATSAVHIVPVFGEKGAWLEHFFFDLFYNFPLTIRRRISLRAEARAGRRPRAAHALPLVLAGTALLAALDLAFFKAKGAVPALKSVWWLALWVPIFGSALISRLAGGAKLGRRIMLGTIGGGIIGLLYTLANTFLPPFYAAAATAAPALTPGQLAIKALWHVFLFTLVAVVGAIIAETRKVS
jgi:hypothetical protein